MASILSLVPFIHQFLEGTIRLKTFPDAFRASYCRKAVRSKLQSLRQKANISPHYKELNLQHSAIFADRPDWAPPHFPNYLLLRPEATLSSYMQSRLMFAMDEVLDSKATLHRHHETSRSNKGAYHFGFWRKYSNTPYITADTRDQDHQVQTAVDNLLMVIREALDVFEKWIAVVEPEYYAHRLKLHKKFQDVFAKELQERPALDLGPLCFAVAIKYGYSNKLHIDAGDVEDSHVILGTAGSYQGGNLQIPQANISVNLPPGGMMAFMARLLAHGNEPVSPHPRHRLIFTGFSCKHLVSFLESLL
ncbi:hypothetical protein FRB90_001291 [Tulasnella sp. 427]|nr:hypothetical protein FRB90_001291 [Tulasnella sp. 427]